MSSCDAGLRKGKILSKTQKVEVEKMGAASPHHVVELDQVLARRQNRALIQGRYTTTRLLEHDYDFDGKIVGSGMSGPVRLATGKDGNNYAIKSFKKNGLSSRKRAELKSEAEVYLTLDHPHVAKLEMIYETEEELHLVMEYMAGGELYKRLSKKKRYSEESAASCIRQVMLAVAYLHAHEVVHRDLKLENFLYENEDSDHVKLIDFGFAKFRSRDAKMSQACGSLHYVAPEVLNHSYTEKADIWSAGVIAYMLLTGAPPFFGTDDEVIAKIRAGNPHWSQRFFSLSSNAQGLVKGMLVADPNRRFSARAVLEHPFVSRVSGREEKVLDMDILKSLRHFAHASAFRRAVLSLMAWSVSNTDRNMLREQFLALDREKRGTITHTELKQVLEESFDVDSAEVEVLFSCLDTDHDDEIEYSEFLAAALLGRVQVHEDLLRKTFSRFDTHETGMITAEDLRSVLGEHFDGAEMEELIREADTSGNGCVDYEEFLDYFQRSDTCEDSPPIAEPALPPTDTLPLPRVPTADTLPPMGSLPAMGVQSTWSTANSPSSPPTASPPTFSTQSAPAYAHSQAFYRKKQEQREKLGAVIDNLLSKGGCPGQRSKVPEGLAFAVSKGYLRPLSRRCVEPKAATQKAGKCLSVPEQPLPVLMGNSPRSGPLQEKRKSTQCAL